MCYRYPLWIPVAISKQPLGLLLEIRAGDLPPPHVHAAFLISQMHDKFVAQRFYLLLAETGREKRKVGELVIRWVEVRTGQTGGKRAGHAIPFGENVHGR